NQDYVVINDPDSVKLLPNTRYKVSFDAKFISGKPSLYLDWSSNDTSANQYDGPNSDAGLLSDADWKHYSVSVNTPDMPSPEPLVLRFVAVGEQKLLVDSISVSGPISE
ncbi:MAG: carbohydrate binding domain-containing protein, partial [Armatimonadota bacterium]